MHKFEYMIWIQNLHTWFECMIWLYNLNTWFNHIIRIHSSLNTRFENILCIQIMYSKSVLKVCIVNIFDGWGWGEVAMRLDRTARPILSPTASREQNKWMFVPWPPHLTSLTQRPRPPKLGRNQASNASHRHGSQYAATGCQYSIIYTIRWALICQSPFTVGQWLDGH